jgi:hypothetical protein
LPLTTKLSHDPLDLFCLGQIQLLGSSQSLVEQFLNPGSIGLGIHFMEQDGKVSAANQEGSHIA